MRVQLATSALLAGAVGSASAALMLRTEDGSLVNANWMAKRGTERGSLLRVPLIVNDDGTYRTSVSMGTPPQDIPFAISLSQNYIAVASKDEDDSATTATFYNPSASSSFSNSSDAAAVSITSGSGDVQAHFAKEKCQVEDFPYNASIALTPGKRNKEIYPHGCTGILGYGVDPDKTAPPDATLLGDYLPAKFDVAVCGVQLGRAGDKSGGIFTMGGSDPNAFKGDFTTVTVPSLTDAPGRPSWSVPLDKLTAANGESGMEVKGALASIDPFYPDITISSGDASTFYSKVPGSSAVPSSGETPTSGTRYTVPCDSKLNFVLTFGGRGFPLDPRDSVVKEGDKCFGAIRGGEGKVYKVGGAFLRNVYMTFGANTTTGNAVFFVAFANLSDAAAAGQTPPPTASGSGSGASPSSKPNAAGLNTEVFGSGLLIMVVAMMVGLGVAI